MAQIDPGFLSRTRSFQGLSHDQLAEVLKLGTARHYPPEAPVYSAGMPATYFYLLMRGHLRVTCANEDGKQTIIRHIHPGSLFGVAAALQLDEYPASVTAASDAIVLFWPTALWPRFAENYPGFAAAAQRAIGQHVIKMHSLVLELANQTAEQRIASAILQLARDASKATDQGRLIDFMITRANISEMTGTTQHTVSRQLSAWEKLGIIRSVQRRIWVTDMPALEAIAAPS